MSRLLKEEKICLPGSNKSLRAILSIINNFDGCSRLTTAVVFVVKSWWQISFYQIQIPLQQNVALGKSSICSKNQPNSLSSFKQFQQN